MNKVWQVSLKEDSSLVPGLSLFEIRRCFEIHIFLLCQSLDIRAHRKWCLQFFFGCLLLFILSSLVKRFGWWRGLGSSSSGSCVHSFSCLLMLTTHVIIRHTRYLWVTSASEHRWLTTSNSWHTHTYTHPHTHTQGWSVEEIHVGWQSPPALSRWARHCVRLLQTRARTRPQPVKRSVPNPCYIRAGRHPLGWQRRPDWCGRPHTTHTRLHPVCVLCVFASARLVYLFIYLFFRG